MRLGEYRPQLEMYQKSADQNGGFTAGRVNVLRHVAEGLTNNEIAEEMGIDASTVNSHLFQTGRVLDTRTSRAGLVVTAIDMGFISAREIIDPLVEEGLVNPSRFRDLTDREREVLDVGIEVLNKWRPREKSKKFSLPGAIAGKLGISEDTARVHIEHCFKKTGIKKAALLVVAHMAFRERKA